MAVTIHMSSISALQAKLLPGQKAVITTHFNPDSDAIGSSLAWQQYLTIKGLDVQVIVPSAVSQNLQWMPSASAIFNAENPLHKVQVGPLIDQADWIFCLDFLVYSDFTNYPLWLNMHEVKR